jgi:hypothetical protein
MRHRGYLSAALAAAALMSFPAVTSTRRPEPRREPVERDDIRQPEIESRQVRRARERAERKGNRT